MKQRSFDGSNILYIVPTPIGNLQDMTYRAVDVLKSVDKIGCEDTRTSGVLLRHYEIDTPTFPCHDHNQKTVKLKVEEYLKSGMDIALISDAGMPGISDPAYEVIIHCLDKGYNVVTLPGANAALTALVSSGLVVQPFTFYGFLSSKEQKRLKELEQLKTKPETIIFYESPHRIEASLKAMHQVFGQRKVTLARELTKKFEEFIRSDLESIQSELAGVKGEIVLIVEGYTEEEVNIEDIDVVFEVDKLIEEGHSTKDAIKILSDKLGIKKREVYNLYHS